jgi:hypothetical protein
MSEIDDESQALRRYVHTIEETFTRLRGAPLLLSSADWQLAQGWWESGVPLDLVCRALEEVFERRRARGAKGKVQGLRYCRHAVDEAWHEVQDLSGVASRRRAEPVAVTPRLAALARALPADLPDHQSWASRILGLRGAPEEVIDRLWDGLSEERRQDLTRQVDEVLAGLSARRGGDELAVARERLRRQRLRRQHAVPVLSLFSREADEEPTDS